MPASRFWATRAHFAYPGGWDAFNETCTLHDTVPVQGRSREAPLRLSERARAQLVRAGYFIATSQQVIRYASFFLVAKSNGHWRGVVNGIPGNEVLAPPHYFTFFTPESWVRRLRALGKFFAVCVDIKGQYNRLRWNANFAHYYAIQIDQNVVVPAVLAMGAKSAVSIGQSVSLLIVAYVEPGEDTLDLAFPADPDMLPAVLELVRDGVMVGCIHICVDNIQVCHVEEGMKEQWVQRLKRNARRFGLDPFKEELHYDETYTLFIGMHYSKGLWNHGADRMERWQRKYGIVPENTSSAGCTAKDWPLRMLSAKDIQRLVGVFVWDCRVRREDVSSVLQEIFGIQYRACRADNPTAPSQAEVAVLKLRWKKFQRNTLQTWREGVPPPVRSARCILVSDASGGPLGRWSFCEMISGRVERDGKGPVNPSGVFEPGVPEPIYYREAHGCCWLCVAWRFRGGGS